MSQHKEHLKMAIVCLIIFMINQPDLILYDVVLEVLYLHRSVCFYTVNCMNEKDVLCLWGSPFNFRLKMNTRLVTKMPATFPIQTMKVQRIYPMLDDVWNIPSLCNLHYNVWSTNSQSLHFASNSVPRCLIIKANTSVQIQLWMNEIGQLYILAHAPELPTRHEDRLVLQPTCMW